ncbi:phage tail tape measure protein [Arthrobacter sp. UYCu712]|uniref:phage tail tape measure protein n=1 Tax=Arthrobacter sp. UYCu712 TaxID=3156340 RepID=UPI0033958AC9
MASERQIVVRIRAEISDFRKQMKEASKVTEEVGKTTQETAAKSTTALGQMVQSANKHERAWTSSGAALLGFGAAVSVGVGLAIKSYMDFDKAMSEVKAATHASAADMGLLRESAIKAGADTSFSAKEAADAISELAKAGVTTKDILGGGLAGALSLAAAGSMEVADAAELAATAMVQFKLNGDQVPHVADLLAAGAGKAQGSVADLGMALKQGGLVAAATGLSIEETTGTLAAFASAGLLGSDSGTSFKTMLQALTPSSKEAKAEMERLGISAYDAKGEFIGMSEFAGVLQNSMKTLSDEERAASQKIIFGADAVRAANVLYEEGAQGISDWTDKVNESGYAAATAAIKQDNLSGDIEKVGGSLDAVFIRSGSQANEVLRGLAQGADKLVDFIGQIPAPLLQTGLGLTAVTGGAALLGGAFLTTFPKIIESKRLFDELRGSSDKLDKGLGRVSKAAGVAAAAAAGLAVISTVTNAMQPATTSFEKIANAMVGLDKGSKNIDRLFADADFGGYSSEINSIGDAVKRMNNLSGNDHIQLWGKDVLNVGSGLDTMRKTLEGVDSTLSSFVSGGNLDAAGSGFKTIAGEAEKQGVTLEQTAKTFPNYLDALRKQATALGVNVGEGEKAISNEELYQWALGNTPEKIKAVTTTAEGQAKAAEYQAKMTEEATKKLEDMGIGAEGTVLSLSKLLDAMFATGLATMSARDAEAKYQENLDALKVSIDKVKASQSAGNRVLDATTGSFDLTTIAGRAANGVFGELETNARNTTKAMADAGATQPELQAKLGDTYKSLYDTAFAFGVGKEKADDMARAALGIPKDVPINVAIQNYADTMAKAAGLKKGVEDIAPFKLVEIEIRHINTQVKGGGYADDPSMTALDPRGRFTGGVVGFAGGGKVPGVPPMNPRLDNVRARTQNGTPYGIRSGEWIINEPQSKANDKWLRAVNDGLVLDKVFGAASYEAPSKSMAGGYGSVQGFSGYAAGSAAGGGQGSSVTFAPNISVNGATDTGAVVQEIWGKFRFEAQKAGLTIGG